MALLRSGAEYFPALIAAIDAATREIHLETYIFADDVTGRAVADALVRAAGRGVTVRVVIDGFGSHEHIGELGKTLERGGVGVAVFRPERGFFYFRKSRLRRMHRKICTFDERVAFVGGINIIDDLNMPALQPGEKPYGPRFDYAVRVEGALVNSILLTARAMWARLNEDKRDRLKQVWSDARANMFGDTRTHRALRIAEAAIIDATASAGMHGDLTSAFVYRDNLMNRREIEDCYLDAIAAAKTDILIANAYFFPGRVFLRELNKAEARGVRVRLLLQGRKEYFLQHYAARALYASLLNVGIEIYEYQASFLHAKVAVIDDAWATVGSSNIDPFSLLLAREANVFVRDTAFVQSLRESLERAIANDAQDIKPEHWRKRGFLDRMLSGLAYSVARGLMRVLGYGNR